jgi:hypothetical protein
MSNKREYIVAILSNPTIMQYLMHDRDDCGSLVIAKNCAKLVFNLEKEFGLSKELTESKELEESLTAP